MDQQDIEIIKAMVTAIHKDRYELLADGRRIYGRLKPSRYFAENGVSESEFPTVGDWVEAQLNREGDSLVLVTLPRRSCFLRKNPSPGMRDQAVAANFDTIFIVMF